jgi:HTH-type transcriptional regulator / antitoxin HigA
MPRTRMTRYSARKLPTDFDSLVRLHVPCAIRDEVSYENAQEMIDALTSLPKLSKGQAEYLDTLTILFEAYEAEHHQIDVSDISPIEALRALMEEHGMNASDLGRILGDRALGPKILSGDRELSKAHIRKLAAHFNVSAALFI